MATVKVMARGCRYRSHIWEAAWRLGGGEKKIKQLSLVDTDEVKDLYENHKDDFMPSASIKNISQHLT